MSYEGYTQYILKDGRFKALDIHDPKDFTPEEVDYWHDVDLTNGYIEDDLSTHDLDVIEVEVVDEERVDKYGNVYFLDKVLKWAPARPELWNKGMEIVDPFEPPSS